MSWSYTPDGLVRALLDDGGQRATYIYDADGNLTSAVEGTGLVDVGQAPLPVELSFNSLDQETKVRTPKAGSANWLATLYGYDLHGKRASVEANREETQGGATQVTGRVLTFAYDQLDRATSQVDDFATGSTSDDEQILYAYTDRGELESQTLQKGGTGAWVTEQSSERIYFDNGQLKTLTNKNASGSMLEQHALSYVQDGIFVNGNRTSDVFQLKGPGTSCYSTPCTAGWTYDARDRLVAEDTGAGVATAFALDVAGNVTREAPSPGSAVTRTYSGLRLATQTSGSTTVRFLYDGYGNQDCKVKSTYQGTACPASGSELLEDWSYDYKNRLARYRSFNGSGGVVNTVSWTNDPLDRPVAETSTVSGSTTNYAFTYVGASDLLAQEVLTGATSATRKYAYDAYDRRATMTDNANRYSYLFDPHGSVSLLVDYAGSNPVKSSYGYTAYGSPVSSLTKTASGFSSSVNAYRYTGKRLDTGSGTFDMGARRYALDTDRFLQVDQYHGALDNLGLSLDPLSGNRYALAAGDPINWVELDGHRLAEGAINPDEPPGELIDCLNAAGHSGCESVAQSEAETMPAVGCGMLCDVVKVVIGVDDLKHCFNGSGGQEAQACVLGILGWTPGGKAGRLGGWLGGIGAKWLTRGARAHHAAKGGIGPVLKGQEGVARAVGEIEAAGGRALGRGEITISTPVGRTRIDLAQRTAGGELRFVEVKNGQYATLNRNQQRVFAYIRQYGGTPVGRRAAEAGFLPGKPIGPTQVDVWSYGP